MKYLLKLLIVLTTYNKQDGVYTHSETGEVVYDKKDKTTDLKRWALWFIWAGRRK